MTRATAIAAAALLLSALQAAPARAGDESARMRADFERLSATRQLHRDALFALPGVVGVGTEVSASDRTRIVITVYVTRVTPELRTEVAARLPAVPVEIIEVPGGFKPL